MARLTVLAEKVSASLAALPDGEREKAFAILRGLFVGIGGMGSLPASVSEHVSSITLTLLAKIGSSFGDAAREKATERCLLDLRAGASAELLAVMEVEKNG